MRKVTTINLNHNAYQIDEEGYETLRRYLQDAELALANNPDRTEIMADLEQAIADKCRLALGQYKSVVSAEEIDRILREMGPVVANAEEPVAGSTAGAATTAPGVPPRPRRLYRILDGKMWTGVCNGLAAFAGVEVTWVRLAFVLLTIFSGGFWFVAYLVLMFVMPVADTPEELSAAHGQPFNAQELVDRVKQKHDEFRADRRARRHGRRHGNWFTGEPAEPSGVPPRPPSPGARVAGNLMLPLFTVLSASWFVAMAVAALMVWHAHPYTSFDWPHGHWHPRSLPHWIPLLAVMIVYVLLALPIGAGRRAAVYYANGGRHYGWAAAWSGLLWIALVVILLTGAWTLLPQLQDLLHDLLGWPTGNLASLPRNLELTWPGPRAREKNMRRVITGNLNGIAYQFEEQALEAAQAYLRNAAASFANNPDRTEILADLEQAIADKCDTFLGRHKTVISLEEMRQVLREMGPVDSSAADSAAAGSSPHRDSAWAATHATPPRRLYRLPREGMLGGVCAGLAAYLNVDVVFVRVAYIVLAFATFGFFIWLVQLCITPKAVTPEEIAAAHGDPLTAREVMARARRSGRAAAAGWRGAYGR